MGLPHFFSAAALMRQDRFYILFDIYKWVDETKKRC